MNACANCGTSVTSNYCPECGQPARNPRGPVRQLLAEFSTVHLSLDAKLFRSLKVLLLEPGRMTASYLRGERAGWVHPVRLYLAVALVCFAVVEIPQPANVEVVVNGEVLGQTGEGEAMFTLDLLDRESGLSRAVYGERIGERARGLRELGPRVLADRFFGTLGRAVPTMSFVLLPIFGALLLLLFVGRGWFYYDHLVFSVHTQSVVLIVFMLGSLLPSWTWSWLAGLAAGHGFLALKHVYRLSWSGVLWRSLPLAVAYVFSLFIAFLMAVFKASTAV